MIETLFEPRLLWQQTIYGNPQSKANSRKFIINTRTKKPMVIKSAEARKYTEDFIRQARIPPEPYKGDIMLNCKIYYQSRRSDLDESLIMDCLQQAGIIGNDRQIREKHVWGEIDPANPRAEISIFSL